MPHTPGIGFIQPLTRPSVMIYPFIPVFVRDLYGKPGLSHIIHLVYHII